MTLGEEGSEVSTNPHYFNKTPFHSPEQENLHDIEGDLGKVGGDGERSGSVHDEIDLLKENGSSHLKQTKNRRQSQLPQSYPSLKWVVYGPSGWAIR